MNKLTKAAIATAVGTALLLGGAGTLASWNSSASINGGTIVAGNLAIASGATGVWKSGSTTIDLSTYKIVPGDTLTYTDTVNVTATGDNLKAKLALTGGSIAASTAAAADVALAGYITSNAVIAASGAGIAAGTGVDAGTYTITAATYVATPITLTVTLTFPSGTAGSNNDSMLGSVSLSNMAVTLTQV